MSSPNTPHNPRQNRTAGTIDRNRLLDKLRGALEHKLTLISAPPGYGKTTLVLQYTQRISRPVAWHAVEEREKDVPNLYTQSLTALSALAPLVQIPALSHIQAPAESASLVIDFIRSHIRDEFIYIFDDVHHLSGSPAAESWLRTFVALAPPNCHIIILSRALPDLPLAEMIARREVLAIGQYELRFSLQEVQELAQSLPDYEPDAAQVKEMVTRLEGWPAGIVLAMHPLPTDMERAMLSGGEGPEALFDALADLMLHNQPATLREFLLASSTLTRITPELCTTALELRNSYQVITDILNRGLFLTKTVNGLTYHALFRNFLQRTLKAQDPERFAQLHVQAGIWFEEQAQSDLAFEHFMAADMPSRAARIADHTAQVYFGQGKVETLLQWTDRLGTHADSTPRLLSICAKVFTDRYDYDSAIVMLSRAQKGYAAQQDAIGLADVQLQEAMILLQRGQYREAIGLVMPLAQTESNAPEVYCRALSIVGMANLRLGEGDAAIRYLECAVPVYRAGGDAYALSQALQDLALAYSRRGRLADASACLQEVVALRRSVGSPGSLALALNNLGYYYHRGSDYKQAVATLEEGLTVIARFPDKRAESYLLWSLADIQRDMSAYDEAILLYRKALETNTDSEPVLNASLLTNFSILRRWQGQYDEAQTLALQAIALAKKHDLAVELNMANAMYWAANAWLGREIEALESLITTAASLRQQGARYELIQVLALCAHCALISGKKTNAEAYLKEAISLGQTIGSAQPLTAEIVHSALVTKFIAGHVHQYDALQIELQRLRSASVKASVTATERKRRHVSTAYSVRVLTLGQESIEVDGERVQTSMWRASTARELFLYLLLTGPTNREQLSLVFWPDASTKQVRQNFHTTLYRIRQALSENIIVFDNDQYRINSEIDVWCDSVEIMNLVIQGRHLPRRDARAEDIWYRAVKLYQGDFLPSMDSEWIALRREALQDTHMEAMIGLAECMQARRDYRSALHVLTRATAIDPYREDIHRAIMNCYYALGEKRKVIAQLRKLQNLLHNDLDTEPSAETIAFVEALVR